MPRSDNPVSNVALAARAPNHLGDGVMALPAMEALARLGQLTIYGPPWAPDLYRQVDAPVVPRGRLRSADTAVLFAPSLRAALEALFVPRRVGTPTDFRRWLLTDVVPEAQHRADTYAALAAAVGATVTGPPRYAIPPGTVEADLPAQHIGLNPVSVSGAVRQWPGFAALAAQLRLAGAPVVVYGGPGEQDLVAPHAAGHPMAVGLSLPAFARALSRCRVFVSNDSGAAHFARACGVATVVVYGSTTPERTGPAGAMAVLGPRPACAPCYGRRCPTALECFDIPLTEVLRVLSLEQG